MIDPIKLAKLRELYAEHQMLKPKPVIQIIQGISTTTYPKLPEAATAKFFSLLYDIDDLLWDILPEILNEK